MRSRLRAVAAVIALAVTGLAAGCTPDLCVRNSDCAVGLVCSAAALCVKPPVDAGESTTDGATGTVDAAPADAAVDGQPVIEGQVR
jgi:hypothetical protein